MADYGIFDSIFNAPGGSPAATPAPAVEAETPQDYGVFNSIFNPPKRGNLAEAGRAVARGAVTGVGHAITGPAALVGAGDSGVAKFGEGISHYGRERFAPSKGREGEFLTNAVPEFLGGVAPGAAAVLGASVLGTPAAGAATGAAIFGAQGAGGSAEEAKAMGATPGQQQMAAAGGGAVGAALGLVPGGSITRGVSRVLPTLAETGLRGGAARTGAAAVEGAGIGAGGQVAGNLIAGQTYDPTRSPMAGVPEAAAVTAAGMGLLHPVLGAGAPRRAPPTAEPANVDPQLFLPPPAIPMHGPDGAPRVPTDPLALPPPRRMQPGTIEAGEPGGVEYRPPAGAGDALALIAHHESKNRPLIGWGETDLSGYPLTETGFPNWPGKPGPKGNSTAAGLYMIERSTWEPIARRLGITDFSPESQRAVAEELYRTRGMEPWAPHNPKLAAAIARGEVADPAAAGVAASDLLALPPPLRALPRPETTYGDNFLMTDSKPGEPQRLLPKPSTTYGEGFTAGAQQTGTPFERAAYAVSQLNPGDPVTRRLLAQLAGVKSQEQVVALRDRMISRGLIASEGGRYTRAATVNTPERLAPAPPSEFRNSDGNYADPMQTPVAETRQDLMTITPPAPPPAAAPVNQALAPPEHMANVPTPAAPVPAPQIAAQNVNPAAAPPGVIRPIAPPAEPRAEITRPATAEPPAQVATLARPVEQAAPPAEPRSGERDASSAAAPEDQHAEAVRFAAESNFTDKDRTEALRMAQAYAGDPRLTEIQRRLAAGEPWQDVYRNAPSPFTAYEMRSIAEITPTEKGRQQRPGGDTGASGPVDRAALRDELYRLVKDRAPTLRLRTLDELVGTIEGRPSPIHGAYHTEARPGGLLEHIASISLGGPDPRAALSHEIVHFLKRAGLFTRDEWTILAGKADKWAEKFGVHDRYRDQPLGIRREEAVAEAYASWNRGDLQLPPGLRRIFGKAKEFFERTGNWLRGRGFQSAEDVFRGIDRGEVGGRAAGEEIGGAEALHARPTAAADPRVEAALAAIRHTPDERPLWQRSIDFAKRVAGRASEEARYAAVDNLDPVGTLEKAGNGGKLRDAAVSAFKAAHLTRELPAMMSQMVGIPDGKGGFHGGVPMLKDGGYVTDPNSKPLSAVLKTIFDAGLQKPFELWMAVTRGKRLLSEGRERLITPEMVAEFKDLDRKHLGPNGENLFRQAQRDWLDYNDRLLNFAEQTGLINKEQRALWNRGDYVPFFRNMGDESPIGPGRGPRGIANQTSGIKALTGGTEKLNSLYENMFSLSESLVGRAIKNEAARRTRDEAIPVGAMHKVSLAEQMASKGKRSDDVVSVMEGGKQEYFRVTQPLLYKAIASFGPVEAGAVVKMLGFPKRLLTTLVTHEPTFMAANLMRDTLHAWVVTGSDFKPGFDTAKGALSALRNSPSAMAIMAGGGGGPHFYGKGASGFVRDLEGKWTPIETPRKMWEQLERVGSASEMANRIAIYESALKRGSSHAEAVWQSKDMMNFTASGGAELMKFLIQTVPFMNARIQGLDRLQRGARENPTSFLMRGAMITAASLGLWALNKDNPEYQALPDYEKQAYSHLFLPGFTFRWPNPFEAGAIFVSMPQMMADLADNGNMSQFWRAFTSNLMHNLNLSPIPQAFAPALDVARNVNSLSGAPIVNQAEQHLVPGERFGPNTSSTMKAIGQQAGVSPDQLETLFKGYSGTLGGYLLSATDLLIDAASDKARPSARIESYPLVGRFIRTEPALANRWINGFYEVNTELNELHATMNSMRKEGRAADMQELVRDNMDKLGMYPAGQSIGHQLATVRQAMKQVHDAPNLSGPEKRERLDQLVATRNAIGEQARGFVERARP